MNDDDFELLRGWVDGDRATGERLVRRYYKEITRFFVNAVGDQECRELTQETFACLCVAAPRFAQRSNFRSFLYGIARNVLNQFLRQRYRKTGEFDPEVHSLEDIESLSISRLISELVRKEQLMQCLRELPLETKQLMELYYWHDMTAEELGQLFDIPAATVRTRLHTARNKLIAKRDERAPDLGGLDVVSQLNSLRLLIGYGPRCMDDEPEPEDETHLA